MCFKDVSPAAKAVEESHSNKQITLFTFTNETSYEYLLIFLKNSKIHCNRTECIRSSMKDKTMVIIRTRIQIHANNLKIILGHSGNMKQASCLEMQ